MWRVRTPFPNTHAPLTRARDFFPLASRFVMTARTPLPESQMGPAERLHDDDGSVACYDDDYRRIGEAMVLWYQKKSARMLTPKAVLRVAELLEVPEIAALNRKAGFGDPAAKRAPLGRWTKAAAKWLALRETNRAMLEGLVRAGYKETIKNLARKIC